MEDIQEQLAGETKSKLQLQGKLRAANEEAERLQDQFEEEEEAKVAVQKQLSSVQVQVGLFCC